MLETLKRLWNERENNGMTLQKLRNAVARDWINETEYKEITGEEYAV